MQKIVATIRKAQSFVDGAQGKEEEKFLFCWRWPCASLHRQLSMP